MCYATVLFAGVGSHYQTRSDQSEEDEGPASSLRRISARDAGKTQKGELFVKLYVKVIA